MRLGLEPAGTEFADPTDPEAKMSALSSAATHLSGATAALARVTAPAGMGPDGSGRGLRLALPHLVRSRSVASWCC